MLTILPSIFFSQNRSFAYAQMSLELAKLVFQYDMELVNQDLDYETECHMHFMWFKPVLDVRFRERTGGAGAGDGGGGDV